MYVERCFDPNGTFRGRDAIRAYWETQICGKQSNIQFRHVEEVCLFVQGWFRVRAVDGPNSSPLDAPNPTIDQPGTSPEEVILDAEKRTAVVQWLACFDNFREKRAEKAEKTVRFCQASDKPLGWLHRFQRWLPLHLSTSSEQRVARWRS